MGECSVPVGECACGGGSGRPCQTTSCRRRARSHRAQRRRPARFGEKARAQGQSGLNSRSWHARCKVTYSFGHTYTHTHTHAHTHTTRHTTLRRKQPALRVHALTIQARHVRGSHVHRDPGHHLRLAGPCPSSSAQQQSRPKRGPPSLLLPCRARRGWPQDKLQKASPNDPNHFSFVTNHSTFSLTTGRNSGGAHLVWARHRGYRAHRRLAALLTRFHLGLAAHTEPSPPVTRGLHEHWLAQQTRCATERCNCGLQADKWLDCV